MLQSKIRSTDLKTQKMQDYILKGVGAIPKVLKLNNRKNLNITTLKVKIKAQYFMIAHIH